MTHFVFYGNEFPATGWRVARGADDSAHRHLAEDIAEGSDRGLHPRSEHHDSAAIGASSDGRVSVDAWRGTGSVCPNGNPESRQRVRPRSYPSAEVLRLGVGILDAEFLASSGRWWKRGGQSRVLAAQYMLVAIGGLTVGLIGGIGSTAADGDRIEYVGADLRLIARVDDVLSRDVRFIDSNNVTEEERTLAGQLLPTRSTTRGGGVIGVLDADLSA